MNPGLRISGLGSGFDVGGTIEKILEIDSRRIEIARERQEIRNERVAAWIDVKTELTNFTQAADKLRFLDVWRAMAPQSSNPAVATATARSNAARQSYEVEVQQLARAHTVASTAGLISRDDPLSELAGIEVGDEFEISGQTFTIQADDTLTTLRNRINAAASNMPADERVTATILDNRLVLQRAQTGSGSIQLQDTVGNAMQTLGFFDPANTLQAAQNAVFTVNNAIIERSRNIGLDDVLDGVTLNLNSVGLTEITIDSDFEAIKEAIREFVDTYNEAAEAMQFYGGINNTDPSNPIPGLLQNDSLIREIQATLRRTATRELTATHTVENAIYSFNGQQGVMNSLSHIGIWTTGSDNRLEIIDESRLDSLLRQEPELVEQLFRGIQTPEGRRENGVALNLYETSRNYTSELDGYIDFRIENIDDEIKRYDAQIERMIQDMENKENRLWREFGAMDAAIGAMNKDLEWLLNSLDL